MKTALPPIPYLNILFKTSLHFSNSSFIAWIRLNTKICYSLVISLNKDISYSNFFKCFSKWLHSNVIASHPAGSGLIPEVFWLRFFIRFSLNCKTNDRKFRPHLSPDIIPHLSMDSDGIWPLMYIAIVKNKNKTNKNSCNYQKGKWSHWIVIVGFESTKKERKTEQNKTEREWKGNREVE